MLSDLLFRLRALLRRGRVEDELDEELQLHLEHEVRKLVQAGMPRHEALRRARVALGGVEQVKEDCRRARGTRWLEEFVQDLRYGARRLRLSPGFAVVAIVSLALGIGANAAIFQLLNAVRLRSLPIERPHELAEIRIIGGNQGMGITNSGYAQLTGPMWELVRDQQQAFTGTFAWIPTRVALGRGADLRRIDALRVSGDFFTVLGVHPWRGRLFVHDDDAGSCAVPHVVVSHDFWQREMNASELGGDSRVTVDGLPHDVIGVTPPEFTGLVIGERFDVALPLCTTSMARHVFDVSVMGRLRPDWTLARASEQLGTISPGLFEATVPSGYDAAWIGRFKAFRLAAYEAGRGVSRLRTAYDGSLLVLLAITGLVLLIACANLANLMLARGSTREREVAVQLALGASRGRLLRQWLTESALLAAIGASLGIGLAHVLSSALVSALSTASSAVHLPVAIDWRVLAFTAIVAAATCLVFGAAPALRASRTTPGEAMKSGGRGTTMGRERLVVQRMMVVTQVAITLLLLVAALLFVRSFRNLTQFDPGMRQDGLTVAGFVFANMKMPRERFYEFKRQLTEEIKATPGIQGASITTNIPLLGGSWGHHIRIGSIDGDANFTWVSHDYMSMMGVRVLKGRDLQESDTGDSHRVALVNETFVRRYVAGVVPGGDPIGLTLRTQPEPAYPSTVYEIVGVIADTKYNDLRRETPPMVFAPATQFPNHGPGTMMLIASNLPHDTVASTVRRVIAERHPEVAMDFGSFPQRIRDRFVRERLMAMLSGFFGLLAVVLASVGLYGVLSYTVARRRNEIGIRVALGAPRGQVVGMVMREASRLVLVGVAIGAVLTLLAGRTIAATPLLFGLTPYDPVTLLVSCGLLGAIAAIASFIPARRAAKLDPLVALRHD